VLTADGIVLIYNGAQLTFDEAGTPTGVAYQPGQVLFDAGEPGSPIARSVSAFLAHTEAGELRGQVDNVCFAQGLVLHHDSWFLYYGMADSRIGYATAPVRGE
jgi:beta-1,2-mannosidase